MKGERLRSGRFRRGGACQQPAQTRKRLPLQGTRNAYYALSAGVWCVLLLAIAHTPNLYIFYAIMGAFAFAELVRLSSQLVYYRMGV